PPGRHNAKRRGPRPCQSSPKPGAGRSLVPSGNTRPERMTPTSLPQRCPNRISLGGERTSLRVAKQPAARLSGVVSIDQPAQTAEDGTFLAPFPPGFGSGGDDAIGQATQGKRLQPNTPRPAQRRKEQPFAAKEGRFDF